MTDRVYVHVGAPKSGTTYLQGVLETNRALLGAAGIRVVGERHLDLVHAGMVIREAPRLERLPATARSAWDRLVAEVRAWEGPVAIISYELLAGASAEQVERALADLTGHEVHVVITARDLAGAVPSAWQERLKFGLTTPLEDWSPRPESAGPRAEWGWRTLDPAGVAARWGATLPPERVHIVTAPRSSGDPTELWRRFAEAVAIDVPGLDLRPERRNESLGVVQTELLRRVNAHTGEHFATSREQALWLRDTLAHAVLAPQDGERIGLTPAQLEAATERSTAAIAQLREAGYAVHGDLDDIRATARPGRTPGEVADGELLSSAIAAIGDLLLLLRDRTRERNRLRAGGDQGAEPGLLGRAKRVIRGTTAVALRRETDELRRTVERLETQLQEHRALQLRVAELTDLVAELMLPTDLHDDEAVQAALQRYREESL